MENIKNYKPNNKRPFGGTIKYLTGSKRIPMELIVLRLAYVFHRNLKHLTPRYEEIKRGKLYNKNNNNNNRFDRLIPGRKQRGKPKFTQKGGILDKDGE